MGRTPPEPSFTMAISGAAAFSLATAASAESNGPMISRRPVSYRAGKRLRGSRRRFSITATRTALTATVLWARGHRFEAEAAPNAVGSMAARRKLQQAARASCARPRSCSLGHAGPTGGYWPRGVRQQTVRHRVAQSRLQELHAVFQLGNLRCQLFF